MNEIVVVLVLILLALFVAAPVLLIVALVQFAEQKRRIRELYEITQRLDRDLARLREGRAPARHSAPAESKPKTAGVGEWRPAPPSPPALKSFAFKPSEASDKSAMSETPQTPAPPVSKGPHSAERLLAHRPHKVEPALPLSAQPALPTEAKVEERPKAPWTPAPPAPDSPPIPVESPAEPKLGFEARLGAVWLPRIGLTLLAIGLAYFAREFSRNIGPAGKTALAYLACIALFGVGFFFRSRLRRFAEPVMAGSLALGFFVSYASHFIAPMRCLSLAPALAWMSASVATIFIFAELRRSQAAAALAILLGHAAVLVAAPDASSFSLAAIVLLSAAGVAMHLRHRWAPLSLLTLGSAYLSHFLWTVLDREALAPAAELTRNLIFLTSYYALFLASDLIGWARSARGDALPRAIPRAAGPANLIAYASLVSFYFIQTDIHFDRIHWFFFALAAVQGGVALARRRFADPDALFYPAFGAIFLTLGLMSAFEALTLNIVLAMEALALLVAAHVTRLRLFHALAQAALLLNFGHYWFFAPGADVTTASFIGGALVVAVYMLKASLEEIWYAPDSIFAWRSEGELGPFLRSVVAAFDESFRGVAPKLPVVHAAAGGLLLTHQCMRYFDTGGAPIALAEAAAALVLLAAMWRRVALGVGALAVQCGAAFALLLPAMHIPSGAVGPAPWVGWTATALLLGAALVHAMSSGRALDPRRRRAWMICAQSAAAPLLVSAFAAFDLALWPFYLASVALVGLVLFHQDRVRAGFRALPMHSRTAGPHYIVCVLAASLLGRATDLWHPSLPAAPVWLTVWSLALIGASALRRDGGLYAAGAVALIGAYGFMIADATLGSRVLDSASAALAIVALTAALAWAKDFGFAVVGGELTRGKREAVAVAVAIPYALAILLAAAFFDRRWDSPWSALALGAFGAALFGAAGAFRLRGGQIAGLGAILLAHAVMLGRLFHRAVLPNDAIWGAALFFALAIGVERLLARWRGLAPDFGPGAPTPQARAVLLGVATFVFMLALHRINILEARWSTAVWSGVGAAIVSLGFAWRSAVYRRTALALFGVCLARVFLFDIWQLGEFYRWLAFVSLGLTLLGVAALYARFSEEMRKWL